MAVSQLVVNLDSEALREATVQAMLGTLTPEVKEKILNNAISNLLQPSTDSWNKNRSPLEVAFGDAINKIAREEAVKMVGEDSALRDKMRDLMHNAVAKVFELDLEKIAQKMADAFSQALRDR